MGIWNHISSTTDVLKRNSPDPTPVKGLCWVSCAYANAFGASTVAMAKNLWPSGAFMAGAVEKMKGVLPDAEARSRINQFTAVFAKNAAVYAVEETLKTVPFGIAVYKVAKKSLIEAKNIKSRKGLFGADSGIDIIVKKKEAKRSEGFHVKKRMKTSYADLNLQHQKPEDVIRIFMMKGIFMARHIFDDLKVRVAPPRKDKSSSNP